MRKNSIVGLVAGLAAGTAVAVAGGMAVARVIKEMKSDPQEMKILSPDGNHSVTLSLGVSAFGKGLTLVRVIAETESGEDECKFSFVVGKEAKNMQYQWVDNDNFELTAGKGLLQQCCDVSFEGEEINIVYYWHKIVKAEVNHSADEEVAEETVEAVEAAGEAEEIAAETTEAPSETADAE